MDTFAKLSAADRKAYFEETAARRNSTSTAIEKDHWVCWCLKRLFELIQWGVELMTRASLWWPRLALCPQFQEKAKAR
jgi:hypothetical protein